MNFNSSAGKLNLSKSGWPPKKSKDNDESSDGILNIKTIKRD
jgi:hypothetical protein